MEIGEQFPSVELKPWPYGFLDQNKMNRVCADVVLTEDKLVVSFHGCVIHPMLVEKLVLQLNMDFTCHCKPELLRKKRYQR